MTRKHLSVFLILVLLPDCLTTTFGTCRAFDAKDRLISFSRAAIICQDTLFARVRKRDFFFQSYYRLRDQFFAVSYKELVDEAVKLYHQERELHEKLILEIENLENEVMFYF